MNNLIGINTALAKADAFTKVANKLLAIISGLPEFIPYWKVRTRPKINLS